MGAYVYALQAPSMTVPVVVNGKTVLAGRLKYIYKPGINNAYWEGVIDRMAKKWDGLEKPEYVVHCSGKPCDGDHVMTWQPHRISVVDDPNWGGLKTIGKLLKFGRTWMVVALDGSSDKISLIVP